ncbi:MAG: DUF58 domain-containing protein [Opitutaceae bacterium]
MSEVSLTDQRFIQRLDSLYLLARRVLGGTLQADRKSTKKGAGITFADYAEYQLGDDYRSIDWRVFARSDEMIIKLFELEEDATIYLLLDCSPSMDTKFLMARQLAAAFGYIALNCLDRLAVYSVADRLSPLMEATRGRARVLPFLKSMERAEISGKDTDFTACCKAFQARRHKRGMVIVISDFLYPNGYDDGLKFLDWHGHDVFCMQLHDPADLKCDWKGDLNLQCVETSEQLQVTVTPKEARAYEAAMEAWNQGLQKQCAKRGIGLASVTTEYPFDSVIQDILRRGGLVH